MKGTFGYVDLSKLVFPTWRGPHKKKDFFGIVGKLSMRLYNQNPYFINSCNSKVGLFKVKIKPSMTSSISTADDGPKQQAGTISHGYFTAAITITS
jgi:hypothetical protein